MNIYLSPVVGLLKVTLVSVTFFVCPTGTVSAQKENINIKDITGFLDSRHHWLDIKDQEYPKWVAKIGSGK